MSTSGGEHTSGRSERLPHASAPLGAAAVVGALYGAKEVPTGPIPEVICGEGVGFIRTAPDMVKGMLTTSLAEGAVTLGQPPSIRAILERAVDLTAHFGQVTIQSSRRRRGGDHMIAVEEYEAVTGIVLDGQSDQSLKIKLAGVLDSSQLSPQAEQLSTPVGVILPEPTVEIEFTNKHQREGGAPDIETHRFVFGRNGAARLERSLDVHEESYRIHNSTHSRGSGDLSFRASTGRTARGRGHANTRQRTAPNVRQPRILL